MFEQMGAFYRGLLLGLMIAAPIGPIGLLCIRRTLQGGLLIGFLTGLGAACADTMFGAVASFSVAAILDFMRHFATPIRFIGGTFLLAVAIHTWREPPKNPPHSKVSVTGTLTSFFSGFLITLTNPVTMFAILAVVATFGGLMSAKHAPSLVAGIWTGSALWWLILSGGISLVRNHFTENRIVLINRITAVALAALAVYAMLSVAWKLSGFGVR